MGKSYTGMGFGGTSVKLVSCQDGTITKYVTESLPEGMFSDGHLVSFDAMADFLKSLVSNHGGMPKDVALVIPSSESLVRRLSLPAMTDKELDLNLPFEFRDYIALGKDKYFFDYAVLNMEYDESGTPITMDLLGCAALKQVVKDYDAMLRRAGMRLRVAMPSVAALHNVVRAKAPGSSFCLVDFSHTNTQLHFFAQGAYDVTRTIEIGGADIDKAIAEAMNVDIHIASGYKVSNFQNCQYLQPCLDLYESVAVDLGRALSFYDFNNPQLTMDDAYFFGMGSKVEPLLEAVRSRANVGFHPVSELLGPSVPSAAACSCLAPFGATLEV